MEALPDHLWILGLGHLGQAFLWALSMLPFAEPSKVMLTLQDDDVVTGSTDSTSILTRVEMVGMKKTRAVASELERSGFSTSLIERRFDGAFEHNVSTDPAVMVCGVDNALARSRIEAPRFPFVVEAGLGNRATDFKSMRIHTFPSQGKDASQLWGAVTAEQTPPDGPAYRRLAEAGVDPCGMTRLAGTAVGAPFVGAVAGTMMLAQVMRLIARDSPDRSVDLDLRSIRSRRSVLNTLPLTAVPSYQVPRCIVSTPSARSS